MNFIEDQIENLIEEIRLQMPSYGSWPFTILPLGKDDLKLWDDDEPEESTPKLCFLIRTDFNLNDLPDYIMGTEEYLSISEQSRKEFVNSYTDRLNNRHHLANWCEMIANLAIGLAFAIAESYGLSMTPSGINTFGIDKGLKFNERNLTVYRLFNVQKK
jgi:hypothetical protein